MKNDKILIVDDDKSVLASLLILFRHHNFDPIIESDPQKISSILKENDIQAIILDMNFRRGHNEGKEGLHWLDSIKLKYPSLNIILITAYGDIDLAVEAVKKGASDFILKPWNNDDLINKTKKIIEAKRKKESNSSNHKFNEQIIGDSSEINECKLLADKVSESSVSVFILGEKGVGKTLFAQFINYQFTKKNTPYIIDFSKNDILDFNEINSHNAAILKNISQISDSQLDALSNKINSDNKFKWITIAESQEELNTFSKELQSKLKLIEINIPPLRSRNKDIEALSEYFLEKFAKRYGRKANVIDSDAMEMLNKHLWYGNVKELEHVMERAVILSDEEKITTEELKFDNIDKSVSNNSVSTLNLLELEKDAIIKAIDDCEGNITKAAKVLGITRTALYRRMEKHDL